MNINIEFKGKELYSRGCTDISEPWKNKEQTDVFTYELYDKEHKDIRTSIKLVDYTSADKSKHINLIRGSIESLLELQEKINIYESLSKEDKDLIEKYKSIYK